MNERIREIATQASVWCDQNIPHLYSEETNGYGVAWESKFAELIIEKFAYELMDLHGSSPEHIIYAAKRYGVEL